MTDDVVLYERRGPAAWITLNRPDKLNAISREMVAALHEALGRAEADDEVKVVVLTGAGRAFSAGFDISPENETGIDGALGWREELAHDIDVTMRVWSLPKPVIAAVRGLVPRRGVRARDGLRPHRRDRRCPLRRARDPVRLRAGHAAHAVRAGPEEDERAAVHGQLDRRPPRRSAWASSTASCRARSSRPRSTELVRRIAPTPLPVLRLTKIALNRAYEAMGLRDAVRQNLELSAMLNAADTPEQREFNAIAKERGVKAALAWRDARYAD